MENHLFKANEGTNLVIEFIEVFIKEGKNLDERENVALVRKIKKVLLE